MPDMLHKLKSSLSLLTEGYVSLFLFEMKRQVWSDVTSYALRRDLSLPFAPPPASIPITLRPFEAADGKHFGGRTGLLHRLTMTRTDRTSRAEFIKAGIPWSYVAVTEDGEPCFIQWLIAPSAGEKAEAYRKEYPPPLSDDEVIMENAFVPKRHRGKRIMACAMAQVAEKGRETGAAWVVTNVEAWNLPSLRGCLASGFHPYVFRRITWRGFKRTCSFTWLDDAQVRQLESLWQRGFLSENGHFERLLQRLLGRLTGPGLQDGAKLKRFAYALCKRQDTRRRDGRKPQ
jgi:hypothetical protein